MTIATELLIDVVAIQFAQSFHSRACFFSCFDSGDVFFARAVAGFAVKAGNRLLREEKFDAVVSVGPPHSVHLAAAKIAGNAGIPFYPVFIDPWLNIAYYKVDGDTAENLGAQVALVTQVGQRSAQRLDKSSIEDVLLTSEKSYILSRALDGGNYFVGVSV